MTLREKLLAEFSTRADTEEEVARYAAEKFPSSPATDYRRGRAEAWAGAFALLESAIPAERAGWPAERPMADDERAQLQRELATWRAVAEGRALRLVELEAQVGAGARALEAALSAAAGLLRAGV